MVTTDVEVDTEQIIKKKADSKGRVTIGAKYADHEVEVVVLEDHGEPDT